MPTTLELPIIFRPLIFIPPGFVFDDDDAEAEVDEDDEDAEDDDEEDSVDGPLFLLVGGRKVDALGIFSRRPPPSAALLFVFFTPKAYWASFRALEFPSLSTRRCSP